MLRKLLKKSVAAVAVVAMAANSISVEAEKLPVVVKDKIDLVVNGGTSKAKKTIKTKYNKGYKVSYKSQNPKVAKVTAKGVVSAKKTGKTNVTVTFSKGNKK